MDASIIDYDAVLSPVCLQVIRTVVNATELPEVPLEWVRGLLATLSYQESVIRGYQSKAI